MGMMDRSRIGGSDVAAIFGRSPWSTPLQVYLEKVAHLDGHTTELSDDESERMRWGKVLEEPIANEFARRTGEKVRRDNRYLKHPDFDMLGAHLDRRIVGKPELLEVKMTDGRFAKLWGEEGSDDIPEQYLLQGQHYLGVTGLVACQFAVLIGGNTLRIYRTERNESLIEHICTTCSQWWEKHVVPRKPPDPVNYAEAASLWPDSSGKNVELGKKLIAEVAELVDLQQQIAAATERADEIKLRLATKLKEASNGLDPEGRVLVTYNQHTTPRVDLRALREEAPDLVDRYTSLTTVRPLRITKYAKK